MAREAALTDHLRRLILEHKNLGFVPAAVYVFGSRAVAGFTAVGLGAFFGFQKAIPVSSLLKAVENILVAGLARVGSDI